VLHVCLSGDGHIEGREGEGETEDDASENIRVPDTDERPVTENDASTIDTFEGELA
jgi:hypothetical protein